MKILIVDDNANNRMILRLLLEEYMEDNKKEFFLDEAEDGQVAIDKCNEDDYDIVLMDIMMPNIDGIEATKRIRDEHKNVMVIAVSAVDDHQSQKMILNNGAEDYISKPVNADIFISRMTNYLAICETRKTKKIDAALAANLFTKKIYSRHTRFIITSEDSLLEFWEYHLLSTELKCDNLSDLVRTVYSFADILRKLKVNCDIFAEESETQKYFTITNVDKIPQKIIQLALKKDNFIREYKIAEGKISFALDIVYTSSQEAVAEEITPEETTSASAQEEVTSNVSGVQESQVLQVFDYIDEDDMYDLEEYSAKLNSIMLVVGGAGVTEEDLEEICLNLDRLGSVLNTYSEIFVISRALMDLSADIRDNVNVFIKNSEALGPMCKAFAYDMTNWVTQSFHTGAPSIDFMNDTIVVNSETIGNMLKMDAMPESSNEEFDDIFDF